MQRRHVILGLGAAGVAAGAGGFWALSSQPEPFALITTEESEQHQNRKMSRDIFLRKSDGPQIIFHAPGQIATSAPIDFDVEFRARGGAAPVMNTLKIDYNLGIAWVDITPRLLAHAKRSGTRLISRNAMIPAGKHEIRLRIEDDQQRVSEVLLKLTIT